MTTKSRLFTAMEDKYNDARTENGMPTHSSSGSWVLDLFFKMGASRQLTNTALVHLLEQAWNENPLYTIKAVFYNRDIRGGQGERRSFRVFVDWLAQNHPDELAKNLHLIPFYGRWDDLFVLFGSNLEAEMVGLVWENVRKGDKLLAKWMPREGKSQHALARKFMYKFGLSPKDYRKLLAGNTKVVETQMCRREWGEVNYPAVPSQAMNRYRKAFMLHDWERFNLWVTAVIKGESKVNAAAIYPHDIVNQAISSAPASWNGIHVEKLTSEFRSALQIQWNALPNYLSEGKRIMPVCDVSGSMYDGKPSAISVCISLGLYLAERNTGIFQNHFITFSGTPELQHLTGKDLVDNIQQLANASWQMNTNLEAVFNLMLNKAKFANLPEEDMPDTILIISDMQFDQAVSNRQANVMELIRAKYATAGYNVPAVVFWNVRASSGVPVKMHESGTALVSGFSPSIMGQIMGVDLSPVKVMEKVLLSERYEAVII